MVLATKKNLMRECVTIDYAAESGAKNTVFNINIPEGYVMEVHSCEFGNLQGSNPIANHVDFFLVDDPDEDANPGHCAEKVITSDKWENDLDAGGGRSQGFCFASKDCFKTLLVNAPNFISNIPNSCTLTVCCGIWFDFVRVSKDEMLDLLRQQQY